MQHSNYKPMHDEDEISLLDTVRSLSHYWKFIAVTTVGLSAIAIAVSFFLPKQYQKQLKLSLKPIEVPISQPVPGLDPISQPVPGLDATQIIMRSGELLQDRPREQIIPKRRPENDKISSAKLKYDAANQRLDLTLRSPDATFLSEAPPKIISNLKSDFQDILIDNVQNTITAIELQIQKNQQGLAILEQQIAQLKPSSLSNPQGMRTIARLEALETERIKYITTISNLKFDKEYLEQAQKNPAEFVSKVISVQILNESSVKQTASRIQIVALSIIASFMVAVLAAIIRDEVARSPDELSKQKIDGSRNA